MTSDNETSRPATNGPAPEISTPTKTLTTSVRRSGCSRSGHDLPPCPQHGCPACAAPDLPYVDPDACVTCTEILTRDAWRRYEGQECEATCALQHCTVCGLCGRSGLVCRVCGVCVEHEEQGSTLACWSTIWSTARRHEVEFYRHELWNPDTGRWGR